MASPGLRRFEEFEDTDLFTLRSRRPRMSRRADFMIPLKAAVWILSGLGP
jgi:hypothetical protein